MSEESKIIVPNEGKELVKYPYADTVITCSICGKTTKLDHPQFLNVQTGLQLPFLPTTNIHMLGLSCSNCKCALTLHFIPAENPPVTESESENKAVEEPKLEVVHNVNNTVKNER